MTQISIVQNLPEQQWRRFVDHHPNANVFHTPEMYEVFFRARNHEPELWAAIKGDRVLALLLPVRINMLTGLLRSLTTRAIIYGSVLSASEHDSEDGLVMLLKAYKQSTKKTALFIECRNLHDLSAIQQILRSCQFTFVDYLNYLVDINLPVEQVWNNIHKSARRNINKALNKNQLNVIDVEDISQLEAFYSILKKTYGNAHVPLADYSLFEAAYQILYPKSMVKFLLGCVNGHDVAASVLLLYKDVIYGWYRGFDRAYASFLPNDLMVWHTLKWGVEHHFHTFDFGGAGKPEEAYGPRQFKAKFGGKQVNYGRNIYVPSSNLLRISKWGYSFYRQIPQ